MAELVEACEKLNIRYKGGGYIESNIDSARYR